MTILIIINAFFFYLPLLVKAGKNHPGDIPMVTICNVSTSYLDVRWLRRKHVLERYYSFLLDSTVIEI